jgi:hypothetical protein
LGVERERERERDEREREEKGDFFINCDESELYYHII